MRNLIFILLVCIPISSSADFTPALIGNGPKSMPQFIEVPDDTPDGEYYIRCEWVVRKSGKAERRFCYKLTESAPWALVSTVLKASGKARFIPATDEGKKVTVFMSALAAIKVENSQALVAVFPNDGVNRKRFGLDYVSPQRLNELKWRAPRIRQKIVWIWMHLFVDKYGAISKSRLDDPSNSGIEMLESVRRSISKMDYRPGFYNGHPVGMDCLEPAYRRR